MPRTNYIHLKGYGNDVWRLHLDGKTNKEIQEELSWRFQDDNIDWQAIRRYIIAVKKGRYTPDVSKHFDIHKWDVNFHYEILIHLLGKEFNKSAQEFVKKYEKDESIGNTYPDMLLLRKRFIEECIMPYCKKHNLDDLRQKIYVYYNRLK
jgi:hypothetical protein